MNAKTFIIQISILALFSIARAAIVSKPVQIVTELYHDFAWEAIIVEPKMASDNLLDQPRQVLDKYFDTSLTQLILKDRECAKKTHEICNLDFSPIWASQDWGAFDLKITEGKRPNTVNVNFTYPGDQSEIKLIYLMLNTNHGWRITDIQYEKGASLRSVLSQKQ